MLARDYFPYIFAASSLLVIFGAATVHPEPAPPSQAAKCGQAVEIGKAALPSAKDASCKTRM